MLVRIPLLLAHFALLGCGINNNCGKYNPFGCAKGDESGDVEVTSLASETTSTTPASTSIGPTTATGESSTGTTTPVEPTTAGESTTTDLTTTTQSTETDASTSSSSTTASTEATMTASDPSTAGPAVCGDKTVEGDEECDGGESDTPGCDFDCTLVKCGDLHVNAAAMEECDLGKPTESCNSDCQFVRRKVFVTSVAYPAKDLGGLAGADAKCQARAMAAGLKGNFLAWLSTVDPQSPATRFKSSMFAGLYVLVNDMAIAKGWTDLTDGTLDLAINMTEFGVPPLLASVWTNTLTDGKSASASHCTNWTSPDGNTSTGDVSKSNSEWTKTKNPQLCLSARRLYCFESP